MLSRHVGKPDRQNPVEGDENSILGQRAIDYTYVRRARRHLANPQNVVPALAQSDDAILGDILVGAEPHDRRSFANGEDLFFV
jgi:hypothetical protein